MILQLAQFKDVCSKLLNALDSDSNSTITETLALTVHDNRLILAITNMEYIMKTKLDLTTSEEFNATVNAEIFLKLINKLTTETIELTIDNNILIVKSNGTYKLPMIYDGDTLLILPDIKINNVSNTFDLATQHLMEIYNYNSKELVKNLIGSPVQKLYYIDKDGCITFTSGACVTNFPLGADIQMLLNSKLVKLFKLFTDDKVNIEFGKDVVNKSIEQTKLTIRDSKVELTAILPSTTELINMVPKDAIRNMAKMNYPYTVTIDKNTMLSIIDRLMLFMPTSLYINPYSKFEFYNNMVNIYDKDKHNVETLCYNSPITLDSEPLTIILDLNDLKPILDSVKEDAITVKFGNSQSVVVVRPNVYNIIPECVL